MTVPLMILLYFQSLRFHRAPLLKMVMPVMSISVNPIIQLPDLMVMGSSTLIAIAGIFLAWLVYVKEPFRLKKLPTICPYTIFIQQVVY